MSDPIKGSIDFAAAGRMRPGIHARERRWRRRLLFRTYLFVIIMVTPFRYGSNKTIPSFSVAASTAAVLAKSIKPRSSRKSRFVIALRFVFDLYFQFLFLGNPSGKSFSHLCTAQSLKTETPDACCRNFRLIQTRARRLDPIPTLYLHKVMVVFHSPP